VYYFGGVGGLEQLNSNVHCRSRWLRCVWNMNDIMKDERSKSIRKWVVVGITMFKIR
jgi:hypothetical protein